MAIRVSIVCGFGAASLLFVLTEQCFPVDRECFWQLIPNRNASGSQQLKTDVKLAGVATGGDLALLEMDNPNPPYVKIETQAGEMAEIVLGRIATALTEHKPFHPHAKSVRFRVEGNLLKSFQGVPGAFVFAGTETGLGIPPPPTSLTAFYDRDQQEISLAWENPVEPYDAIAAFGGLGPDSHPPGTTRAIRQIYVPKRTFERDPRLLRDENRRDNGLRRYYVVGCRDGVLSNAAVVTWDFDDNSQSELDVQPFTGGISPNWKAWSSGGEAGALVLEQGTRGEWKRVDQMPVRVLEPGEKRFFQRIKTASPGVVGGVYRKFLGLKPGHTYRITTRMNTFGMDKVQDNWSFSFHAAPHAAKTALTPDQMAGTAALPEAAGNWEGRKLVAYGPGTTTAGKFAETSTEKAGPGGAALDVTMPPGAETITVWFRYSGPPGNDGVGFDWIKLKDITAK